MNRHEAEGLLGLAGSYTYQDFQKAYREAVKNNHPDRGGDTAAMVRVNIARETITCYFADDKGRVMKTVSVEGGTRGQEEVSARTYEAEPREAHKAQSDDVSRDFCNRPFEGTEYARREGWIGRHPKAAGWIYVFTLYYVVTILVNAVAGPDAGSNMAAIVGGLTIELITIVVAIATRNKVVRTILRLLDGKPSSSE